MDVLKELSFDVRHLMSITEKIQSAILRGRTLNQDEREIVHHCANELLALTKRVGRRRDHAEKVACSMANANL
jgi:hypothetical protein